MANDPFLDSCIVPQSKEHSPVFSPQSENNQPPSKISSKPWNTGFQILEKYRQPSWKTTQGVEGNEE